MKYLVTYCAFDTDAGSNPLWHSAFILSQWDENTASPGPIDVVSTYGFYGVPTTTRNTWTARLKLLVGFDVDLNGNHGMLRSEETRYMDFGAGLHGASFEVTQDQFQALQTKCKTMIKDQEETIQETATFFNLKPTNKARIYSHEQSSRLIFDTEKIRAENQGREPRLKPFEINPTIGWSGPSLSQSFTCKSQTIRMLEGILSQAQINRLTEHGKHPAVPRYSGPMEPLALYSEGPLKRHRKANGSAVYFRDGADPKVKLRWTLPPQEIEILSEETSRMVTLPPEHLPAIRRLCKPLQRVEWVFINAELASEYEPYRQGLIDLIRTTYQAFSKPEPKEPLQALSGWRGLLHDLFSIPRNQYEATLMAKIKQGNMLLNALYMAIVDNWQIDVNAPCEDFPHADKTQETCLYENPLEAVAAYLHENDKIQVCRILGRSYVHPEDDKTEDASPHTGTAMH